MDNFDCLKTLTEDIVEKQHYSSESLKTLCRKTNAVSSDLSNLINSLQMVGNKQFAENRVQEDDSMHEQLQQRKDISLLDSSQVPVSRHELKLSSILLKAIELVPASDLYDTPPDCTLEPEDAQTEKTQSIDSIESFHLKQEEPSRLEEPSRTEEPSRSEEVISSPKINRPLDHDRVVDILKRYSLYDDDEDESE